jgi:carbamoyl-phosphate synthase large subunit
LASKATGFPIVKIAAQLAVGMRLDEIDNDITKKTPACFEPTLDYVVVKIPRWNFEKFPGADRTLGTSMKSVGEVMGLGGTFAEALLKAISSLEGGYTDARAWTDQQLRELMAIPTPGRLPAVFEALRRGIDTTTIHDLTHYDPWFIFEMQDIVSTEQSLEGRFLSDVGPSELRRAKRAGMPDAHLARIFATTEDAVLARRLDDGTQAVFKRVDTCAAEFESHTPYLYSTYEEEDEAGDDSRDRVVILGNGPNRIGQGLEFDYCCCHAAYAIKDAGLCAVMVNCNPETVSTDYDTSDKLYFEPITAEHVGNVLRRENPRGVVLQFGGQTPLKLAHRIGPVLGTSADAIDLCEDRERFNSLLKELGVRQPEGAMVSTREEAHAARHRLGFPLLVRPSYVLGGRAMAICYDERDFANALEEALEVSEQHPVLMDRFLDGAIEYDVDALCDGKEVVIAGIMEHVEEAGVHSGDSACVIPPVVLGDAQRAEMESIVERVALRIGVVGLVNVQFAVKDDKVYVIEVNPRASRTVPYVSKATGLPLARLATLLCLGKSLAELGPFEKKGGGLYYIKAPVFPWSRFTVDDVLLGPEMHSTGEVMGVGRSFGEAYAKALIGAGLKLPERGEVFISLCDRDKHALKAIAKPLHELGYQLSATSGTHAALSRHGIPSRRVYKVREGRPDIVDHVRNGAVQLMVNTPMGRKGVYDEAAMRLAGLRFGVPTITTLRAAEALVQALRAVKGGELQAVCMHESAWS